MIVLAKFVDGSDVIRFQMGIHDAEMRDALGSKRIGDVLQQRLEHFFANADRSREVFAEIRHHVVNWRQDDSDGCCAEQALQPSAAPFLRK